jgi:hypothetical protein
LNSSRPTGSVGSCIGGSAVGSGPARLVAMQVLAQRRVAHSTTEPVRRRTRWRVTVAFVCETVSEPGRLC